MALSIGLGISGFMFWLVSFGNIHIMIIYASSIYCYYDVDPPLLWVKLMGESTTKFFKYFVLNTEFIHVE